MAKILKIDGDIVYIGLDDGSIETYKKEFFNYSPAINDNVKIYNSGSTVIICKETNTYSYSKNTVNNTTATATPIYERKAENKSYQTYVPITENSFGKHVNKVAYCLLALFLGGLGIHKFYAGHIGWGIIYILFSWTLIPAFVAFVEFLIALFKHSDEQGRILM